MRKIFRITSWIIVLFVAVCTLALGALYWFADPNKLKPVIANEVSKRTGYHLVIDGDLTWSLYPRIGVKAAHVTLTAPNQSKPFLDLKRMNIAVDAMQLLRGYSQLNGEVHIGEVTLLNVHLTSALVGLHWQEKILTLRPLQASLYGGSLNGFARAKNFSAVPAWNWDISLSHIEMQPFLRDANGNNAKLKLSGTGQLRLNASTQGINQDQMLCNLNGNTDFSIVNGAVEGIDLNYLVSTADALLNKTEIAVTENLNETEFSSLTGSLLINNGLAQTNNLLMNAENFRVKGQGSFQLPNQSLDLALQLQPEQTQLQWDIPVLIRGALAGPNIQIDMRELNKQVVSRELNKAKDKLRETIKEKVPGKAGEALQKLLGQ